MYSEETKMKFAELRALGQSYDRIAIELKVSKLTLIRWAEEYEPQIKNLKAAAWDSIVTEFSAAKKDRLRFLAEILQKIHQELTTRNFSEVSPDKLIEVAIKTSDAIAKLDCPTTFEDKVSIFMDDSTIKMKSWAG